MLAGAVFPTAVKRLCCDVGRACICGEAAENHAQQCTVLTPFAYVVAGCISQFCYVTFAETCYVCRRDLELTWNATCNKNFTVQAQQAEAMRIASERKRLQQEQAAATVRFQAEQKRQIKEEQLRMKRIQQVCPLSLTKRPSTSIIELCSLLQI